MFGEMWEYPVAAAVLSQPAAENFEYRTKPTGRNLVQLGRYHRVHNLYKLVKRLVIQR